MKALTFEELQQLAEFVKTPLGDTSVILKTKGKFGKAMFCGFKGKKAVFEPWDSDYWSCPNIENYGKTWVVYPDMPENQITITQAQLDELNQLEENDQEAYNRKLRELFGITAQSYTEYDYYCNGKYVGNSYEDYPIDLLNEMGVEIEK